MPEPATAGERGIALVRQPGVLTGVGSALRKTTPLFGVLSLCLSGACLGQMIILMYQWHRKNVIFLTIG